MQREDFAGLEPNPCVDWGVICQNSCNGQ